VTKARHVQAVPVFTADFLARAAKDPQAAAAEMGVDADTLKRMLSRERDTVLVDQNWNPLTTLALKGPITGCAPA
jgi:hypothetical protein